MIANEWGFIGDPRPWISFPLPFTSRHGRLNGGQPFLQLYYRETVEGGDRPWRPVDGHLTIMAMGLKPILDHGLHELCMANHVVSVTPPTYHHVWDPVRWCAVFYATTIATHPSFTRRGGNAEV